VGLTDEIPYKPHSAEVDQTLWIPLVEETFHPHEHNQASPKTKSDSEKTLLE
jgi:hypothetical protein